MTAAAKTKKRPAPKADAPRKADVYERVTAQIIERLEAGVVPWHRPWRDAAALPRSMATGKVYRGINVWILGAQFRSSAWWGTYRQISTLGGQVRKGERGSTVMFWKPLACEHGDAAGKCAIDGCHGRRLIARAFTVFNAEQADDLPERFYATPEIERVHEPLDAAETIVSGYVGKTNGGPTLDFHGARACYSPTGDYVAMPKPEAFDSGDEFYSTLFHELTHSTGHKSRLARKDLLDSHRFGDPSYSREELTAEMGAAFLSAIVGIEQATIENSAAYLDNWLAALRGDHKLIVDAASAAQRAVALIVGDAPVGAWSGDDTTDGGETDDES